MSRRFKRNKKGKSPTYLNDEYAEVQEYTRKAQKGKKMPIQLPAAVKGGAKNQNTGSYSGGWSGTGYSSGHESHTHKGTDVVYESNGKQLYAGNGRGVDESSGFWDLIIDCASQLPFVNQYGCVKERSDKRFDVLRKYIWFPKKVQSEILSLDWPDMGILPAGLDFWLKLWEMLPAKTVAMCFGGHGRTGTCLAALMIANGEDYYDTIDHIRTQHCDRAIETVGQCKYLHGLFVEMLKRNIKHEQDPKVLEELTQDLLYAEAHVPNVYSDYGEPEPPLKETKITGFQSTSTSSTKIPHIKLVEGVYYEKVCLDKGCVAQDCKNETHMGWIEYDLSREPDFATH